MTLISMENVTLTRQGRELLKNLNWQVEKNQMWVILGLNGSGKTTLLKLLMAEYWQTEGQVEVLGTNFGSGDITQLRQKIGVVGSFIAERLEPGMLVEKIVLTGKYKSSILYKAYEESDLEEARQMMISLGGKDLLGRKYFGLSQGEKQLVLIARSLMENPDIIILDEATSGLDLFARERLLKQIERIRDLPHAPLVIYVTHHIEEITDKMTHVLLLKQGQIIKAGEKNQVLTEEILADFYDSKVSIVPIGDNRVYVNPEMTLD